MKPLNTRCAAFAALIPAIGLSLTLGAGTIQAQTPAEFYKGKTVNVLVGIEPGTGFDLYGRTLARHMGRHMPGNPVLVVNNMPGASGLVAYNWLANVGAKDGTVFGMGSFTIPFEPMFGNKSARFDATKMRWVGNMDSSVSVCLVRNDTGVASFSDLMSKQVTVGGTGTAGPISQAPKALKALTGAKLNLVEGYKGTASVKLAIERNEVQGVCGLSLSTVRTQYSALVERKQVRMILQLGPEPHPELGDVPHVFKFAKDNADLQVFRLIFGPQGLGRSFVAPAGIPEDRLQALRAAFTATMKDPAFLADAKAVKLDLRPQTGAQVENFVRQIYTTPPQIVERAKKILNR